MNKNHVKISIEAVKMQKEFNMDTVIKPLWPVKLASDGFHELHACNTAACIAGATMMHPDFLKSQEEGWDYFAYRKNYKVAMRDFWEIDIDDVTNICARPTYYGVLWLDDVTKDMALKALNYLLEHGTTEGFSV